MRYKQKHGGKERWDDAAIGTLSSGMGGVASEQGWAEAPKALDFEAADELAHSADRSKDRIGKADELRSQGASAPGLSESEISAMSTPNQQSQAKYRQFSPANLVIGGFAKSMPQIQLPFLRVQGSSCLGKDLRLSSASADDSLCIVGHSMQQHTPICKQEGDQSTSPLSLLTPVGGQPSFLSEAHDSEALLNNSTILSNSIEEEVPCSCEEKGADSPEMSRIRDFMQVRHFAEHDVFSEGLDEDQDESPHMGRRLFGISSKSNVPPADDMDMDNELCGTPIVCMNACTPTASAAVANQFGLLAGTIPPSPEPIRSKQKGRTALLKREDFTPYLQRAASALLYEMHYE